MDSLKLRELILNARRPIIFKQLLEKRWKCVEGSLEDWCKEFHNASGGAEIAFERMPINSQNSEPQWERKRESKNMTMLQFFDQKKSDDTHWIALNYKTPDEIPLQCKEGIDFAAFGFPHITEDYARFWLSSKGANTPCHKDTYGCNLVVQAFGSKLWFLFPPEAPLTSTRLPYEESSIYCLENFYAPSAKEFLHLRNLKAYVCRLEPGDVLCVPRHWWHFVETETTSLSINAWIPLEIDKKAQLEECVVKYFMEKFAKDSNTEVRDYMLNPNQRDLSDETDTLKILAYLSGEIKASNTESLAYKRNNVHYDYQYLDEQEFSKLLGEFPKALYVKEADGEEFKELLQLNAKRLSFENSDSEKSPLNEIQMSLLNSLCSEGVIKDIVNEFQKRYEKYILNAGEK